MECKEYVTCLRNRLTICESLPIGFISALNSTSASEKDRIFQETGCDVAFIAYRAAKQKAEAHPSRSGVPYYKRMMERFDREPISMKKEVAAQLAAIIEPEVKTKWCNLLRKSEARCTLRIYLPLQGIITNLILTDKRSLARNTADVSYSAESTYSLADLATDNHTQPSPSIGLRGTLPLLPAPDGPRCFPSADSTSTGLPIPWLPPSDHAGLVHMAAQATSLASQRTFLTRALGHRHYLKFIGPPITNTYLQMRPSKQRRTYCPYLLQMQSGGSQTHRSRALQ